MAAIASRCVEGDVELRVVDPDKRKKVAELKRALKDADELYLATDEDREGEAIAWHLVEALKPKVPIKRMVFHEITKEAIQRVTREAIAGDYEAETGEAIVRAFAGKAPADMRAVLVAGHGPFTWGPTPAAAVESSIILEEVVRTALITEIINPGANPIARELLDKHFLRKHGADAYYGQPDGAKGSTDVHG